MRLFKRDGETSETFQPKLWLALVGLLLIGGYLFAFAVKNDDEVHVDFVLGTARTSLLWTILLSLVLGLIAGLLLSQLYRRRSRRRHERREPADPV